MLVEQAKANARRADVDEDADLGPLNNASQLERVSGFIDRLPVARAGADRRPARRRRAATSTSRPSSPGCSRTTRSCRHEVFGPVITVQRFSDEAEAVRVGERHRVRAVVERVDPRSRPCDADVAALDFGCVWINTHIPLVAEMPHGGFKHSGYGKDLSMYGLEDYTRIKHVMSYIGDRRPGAQAVGVVLDETWPLSSRHDAGAQRLAPEEPAAPSAAR